MEDRKLIEELTIVPLLTKYIRGEGLSALEKKTIDTWVQQSNSNKALFDGLRDKEQLASDLIEFHTIESGTDNRVNQLNTLLDNRKSNSRWKGWFTAAAVLLAISISSLLYIYFQSNNNLLKTITSVTTKDIDPGKDQATLTFEDGNTIALKGEPVKTDNNGTYYADGTSIAKTTVQNTTLTTPRKGQYQITLPDGTKVWLNAESSLKYPTQFTENERVVELKGEGYFEVAHNAKKPFIVNARNQKLKVLGTKFNISSYENETAIQTTLISGKVELTNSQNNTPVILKPGQQGKLFSLSSIYFVDDVDTEVFTAWTRNDFQFTGIPLKEAFKQLERWYDIDVDYSQVPAITVSATISREKKLSSVLYALEQITNLKFEVQKGRRLTIIK
ncbi:MAG: FecR domain-containing protein [Sphingobacterium sp.]|jgi:ferric-dicitrate binding protein FerR (iron transport regulator)|nr:FecR domain-containing protein [Sphingobacterium sp.]